MIRIRRSRIRRLNRPAMQRRAGFALNGARYEATPGGGF